MKRKTKNPAELVIFANPSRPHGHKAGCKCFICERLSGKSAGEKRTKSAKAEKGKRNPDEMNESTQAVRLYQEFHGKDPTMIVRAQRSAAMRTDYTALGQLLGIGLFTEGVTIPSPDHWEKYPHLEFDPKPMLASNAGGTQLYSIGGNQDLADVLPDFDVDAKKDLLDLGPIAFVVYLARKAPSFAPTEWMHAFDEPIPSLAYDQIKCELFFVGGGYSVKAPGIMH